MTTPNPSPDKFIRLSRPAQPVVRLTAEHDADAPLASTGEWTRLSRPALPVVKLMSEPVAPIATVVLRRPLADGQDPSQIESRVRSLVTKLNEIESLEGRAGVSVDGARSGTRSGEVVIVLVPNDPTDALATCKRVANILFSASPGVTVKVFGADEPEKPVYELAV